MFKEELLLCVASFKAVEMWMHSAHHLTKGPAFISTHEMLYGRIYETLSDDFDKVVEKLVYSMQDEDFGCPVILSSNVANILSRYDSPSNLDEKSISMLALILLVDHVRGVETLHSILKSAGKLTLGMEDFLGSAYNQYESYAYMLNQHIKI